MRPNPRRGTSANALAARILGAEATRRRPSLPVRARPGRSSALSVFPSKSVLYGGFVWARGALNGRKRRFPARAVAEEQRIVLHTYGAALLFHLTFHRLSLTLHLTFHCLFTAFRIGGWRAAVGQG